MIGLPNNLAGSSYEIVIAVKWKGYAEPTVSPVAGVFYYQLTYTNGCQPEWEQDFEIGDYFIYLGSEDIDISLSGAIDHFNRNRIDPSMLNCPDPYYFKLKLREVRDLDGNPSAISIDEEWRDEDEVDAIAQSYPLRIDS